MPSRILSHISTPMRILVIATLWLGVVSVAHYELNVDHARRVVIRMGYMPVITNFAAPLLDYAAKDTGGLRFEALKFSSFAEMGESLRNEQIQAAFIIAPLSVVLHQQKAGIKIVYIGNRHESTLVVRKDLPVNSFQDLAGRTIAVPMRYSGHNLCTRRLAEQFGISGPSLQIVEMNPPDMAAALAVGALDAYFVGEPFAAKSVVAGESKPLVYVETVWPNFICNLLLVKQEFIDKHPERVKMLVQSAARSGLWAKRNRTEAARIAAKYWNQPVELVEYAMNTPPDRIVFDKFVPEIAEIQLIADLMVKFKLSESADVTGLVDDRWAKGANLEGITDITSVVIPPKSRPRTP